jgi:hypothetical protein
MPSSRLPPTASSVADTIHAVHSIDRRHSTIHHATTIANATASADSHTTNLD